MPLLHQSFWGKFCDNHSRVNLACHSHTLIRCCFVFHFGISSPSFIPRVLDANIHNVSIAEWKIPLTKVHLKRCIVVKVARLRPREFCLNPTKVGLRTDISADLNSKLAGWRLHQGFIKIYIWNFGVSQNFFPEIEKFSILDSMKTELW